MTILATGPTVPANSGTAAHRTVLRQLSDGHGPSEFCRFEYVVHNQRFYSDGTKAFDGGDYFNGPLFPGPLTAAFERFATRCRRDVNELTGV